ncbi:MAG: DUF5046 domain-containing protein [Firmicutes bacterium]|nr:DUF5046 domain-containing protein [Bacillota bacterium]
MKKKFLAGPLLAAVTLLALCGCSQGTPADDGAQTATQPAPKLINYYLDDYRGILNENGVMVAQGSADSTVSLLTDNDGKQKGVMKWQYDREYLPDDWRYLTHNSIVTFYDAWGDQLNHIDFQQEGNISFVYSGGDLSTGLFLVAANDRSGYQILNYDGSLLLEQQLELPEGMLCDSISMEQNGTIVVITYNMHDENWNSWKSASEVWDVQGNPVTLTKDYDYIYRAYDDASVGYGRLPYFVASYTGSQNVSLYDILDVDGSIMIEGLNECGIMTDGYITCRKGFEQGLMDFDGNWVYKESLFTELED